MRRCFRLVFLGQAMVQGVPTWRHSRAAAAGRCIRGGAGRGRGSGSGGDDRRAIRRQANLTGPKGPGWIVKLEGCHYHNDMQIAGSNYRRQFVRNTLIYNLLNAKVKLPNDKGVIEDVSMQELGITYPVLVSPKKIEDEEIDNPFAGGVRGEIRDGRVGQN